MLHIQHPPVAPMPITLVVRLIDGARFSLSAPAGTRAVDAIRAYGLPLKAECEGQCHCTSCHVRMSADWADRVAAPSDEEAATLRATSGVDPTSRLLCRVTLTPELDGLDIEIDPSSLVPQTSWAAG